MVKKKHINIFVYSLFALFIMFNILFFTSDYCFACEKSLIEEKSQIIDTISLNEWKNKISSDVIILDIRTLQEFNSGNIDNSINIDFYSPNFKEELSKLDKNKTYLIYCRSGNRGNQALKIFEELGFREVYNLEGGISIYN